MIEVGRWGFGDFFRVFPRVETLFSFLKAPVYFARLISLRSVSLTFLSLRRTFFPSLLFVRRRRQHSGPRPPFVVRDDATTFN